MFHSCKHHYFPLCYSWIIYTSFESIIEISVTIKRIIGRDRMYKMRSDFWIADQQAWTCRRTVFFNFLIDRANTSVEQLFWTKTISSQLLIVLTIYRHYRASVLVLDPINYQKIVDRIGQCPESLSIIDIIVQHWKMILPWYFYLHHLISLIHCLQEYVYQVLIVVQVILHPVQLPLRLVGVTQTSIVPFPMI